MSNARDTAPDLSDGFSLADELGLQGSGDSHAAGVPAPGTAESAAG